MRNSFILLQDKNFPAGRTIFARNTDQSTRRTSLTGKNRKHTYQCELRNSTNIECDFVPGRLYTRPNSGEISQDDKKHYSF